MLASFEILNLLKVLKTLFQNAHWGEPGERLTGFENLDRFFQGILT